MAVTGLPLGRAGQVTIAPSGNNPIVVEGIAEFLRAASKADENFNKEMRLAAKQVAQLVVDGAKVEASTVSRNRQAEQVMKGMKARSDRIPTVALSPKEGFVSVSRPNRLRKRKVTRGDVFFGAEFGGQARPSTRQFLRHRGRSGYFFWQTVRKKRDEIATEYLKAIQDVLTKLAND
jgi:hypothetical protein